MYIFYLCPFWQVRLWNYIPKLGGITQLRGIWVIPSRIPHCSEFPWHICIMSVISEIS